MKNIIKDIKDITFIVSCTFGLVIIWGICVAIMFGIPATAIVWIIKTIQG